MRKSYITIPTSIAFLCCTLVFGTAYADVKIIYPFAGATLPKADPAPGSLSSYYVPISFSVICKGGPHKVIWEIDNDKNGEGTFYDQITVQYIQKLAGGGHYLKVESDDECGFDDIKFIVGS